jgi:hypothetical protein
MMVFEVPIRGGTLRVAPHEDGWRVDGTELTHNECVLLDGACLLPCFTREARTHVGAVLEGRFNCHILGDDEAEDEYLGVPELDDALDEMLIYCRKEWVWVP